MLSGETSVGRLPDRRGADDGPHHREHRGARARADPAARQPAAHRWVAPSPRPRSRSASCSACKYLITFTPVRRHRQADVAHPPAHPHARLHARASTPARRLALAWGIETYLVPMAPAHRPDGAAGRRGRCSPPAGSQEGDLVVIVAGSPPGIPGSTNALRVHRIGDANNRVAPAYSDLADLSAHRTGRGRVGMLTTRPGRGGGMADTEDSKSSAREGVRVQVPLPAHE